MWVDGFVGERMDGWVMLEFMDQWRNKWKVG